MADMLTREQIEQLLARANDTEYTPDEFTIDAGELRALCSLALVGLAVQPRLSEEAPKDGTRILALWGGEWVITYWAKRPGFEGWQMPSGMVVKAYDRSAWQPVQFTSLPEPRT